MILITATQQFSCAIEVHDAKGNPAPVEGVPAWSVSDDTKLEVEPAEDGMSATIVAVGPLADTVQVNVTCDADLGEGVTPLVGVLDVQIVAGEASMITLTPGTPEEAPVEPPVEPITKKK